MSERTNPTNKEANESANFYVVSIDGVGDFFKELEASNIEEQV